MKPFIGTMQWGITSTGRFGVVTLRWESDGKFWPHPLPWAVMDDRGSIVKRDDGTRARFDTHAEAITYAQEHAKTQALKEPS